MSTTCSCTPQLQNSFVFSSKTWVLLPTKFASFKIHSLLVVELFCHSLQNSLITCLQNLLVIKFNKTSCSSCLPCDFNLHFVSVIEASILITCAPFGEESIRPHLSRQNCSFHLSRWKSSALQVKGIKKPYDLNILTRRSGWKSSR